MKSIRRHLTRHLLGATCVLLGGGLFTVYLAAREALVNQFDDTLRAKALAISTITRLGQDGVRVDFHDRFLRGFDDDKEQDFFQLWDENGRTVARSESLGRRRELDWRSGKPGRPSFWNMTLPNGEAGRAVAFTFEPPHDSGTRRDKVPMRLAVASERDDLDESLTHLLALSVGCGVLLTGATVVLIPWVLRRGLRPLEKLADQTAQINAASLATRFPTAELPTELQPIASQLNELLSRLEQSFERERRFSADLAHELRTPLAELRSAAECVLKWPETRSPATDHETLAVVRQMEALVAQMLALTRGEQGQLAPNLESVKLDELFSTVWQRFTPRAGERKLAVSLALKPLEVAADPGLLRSILTNLCANAVEYTPAGGHIEVDTRSSVTQAVLQMTNSVEDLSPDDVERMFDRFWRKQSARGGPHLGLGLSLAQSFASAMNWQLSAHFSSERRLTVTLAGPTASSPADFTRAVGARRWNGAPHFAGGKPVLPAKNFSGCSSYHIMSGIFSGVGARSCCALNGFPRRTKGAARLRPYGNR